MEKLKYSSFLKLLCYLLIPIVAAVLILSMADVFITAEYGDFNNQQDTIKTYNFGEEYLYNIISEVRYIKTNQERILDIADEIILMKRGKIEKIGNSKEILEGNIKANINCCRVKKVGENTCQN